MNRFAVSVDKKALQDQADILFLLASEVYGDDAPNASRLLSGAGNLLYGILVRINKTTHENVIVKAGGTEAWPKSSDEFGGYEAARQEVIKIRNEPRKDLRFYQALGAIATLVECEVELDEERVWDLLMNDSRYATSFLDYDLVSIEDVFVEDERAYVVVEDEYYDVEDQESRRTFEIVHAKPGLDDSGLDFEEL
jgi:hypothetical protein